MEPAESCSLSDSSADIIVVAQAFHWFEQPAFLAEVGRVLRSGGLLAILIYQLAKVTPSVDAVVERLYREVLDGFWPAERQQVEQGLEQLVLPFTEVRAPKFEITVNWSLRALVDYLGTWSAVRRCRSATHEDPIDAIIGDLETAWGDSDEKRRVVWPVGLRVCRHPD